MRILFLSDFADDPLLRWNVHDIVCYLNSVGVFAESIIYSLSVEMSYFNKFDVVIFYRTSAKACVDLMINLKKTMLVGYLIDDLIWVGSRVLGPAPSNKVFELQMENSDFNVFPNKLLQKYAPKKDFIIKNPGVGSRMIDVFKNLRLKDKNIFKIAYTKGHVTGDSKSHVKNVVEMLSEHKDIELHCWARDIEFNQFKGIKVINHGYKRPIEEFWKSLIDVNPHVVLNPLDDAPGDDFNNCKSNPKYFEAGLCESVLIAPRVRVFNESIKEGVNGFFASTPEETVQKILYVYKNRDDLESVGKNAKKDILENYIYDVVAKNFVKDIQEIQKQLKKPINNKINQKSFVQSMIRSNDFVNNKPQEGVSYLEGTSTEITTPPINQFNYFEQSEELSGTHISGFWIKGATFMKRLTGPLKVEVFNKSRMIYVGLIDHNSLIDNNWWPVNFQETKLIGPSIKIRIYNQNPFPVALYTAKNESGKVASIGNVAVKPAAVWFIIK